MKADRSQFGFALMEPAFLRFIVHEGFDADETMPRASAPNAVAGWRARVAARWSTSAAATMALPGRTGRAQRK